MKNLEKLAELARTLPAPLQENAAQLVSRMGKLLKALETHLLNGDQKT